MRDGLSGDCTDHSDSSADVDEERLPTRWILALGKRYNYLHTLYAFDVVDSVFDIDDFPPARPHPGVHVVGVGQVYCPATCHLTVVVYDHQAVEPDMSGEGEGFAANTFL